MDQRRGGALSLKRSLYRYHEYLPVRWVDSLAFQLDRQRYRITLVTLGIAPPASDTIAITSASLHGHHLGSVAPNHRRRVN